MTGKLLGLERCPAFLELRLEFSLQNQETHNYGSFLELGAKVMPQVQGGSRLICQVGGQSHTPLTQEGLTEAQSSEVEADRREILTLWVYGVGRLGGSTRRLVVQRRDGGGRQARQKNQSEQRLGMEVKITHVYKNQMTPAVLGCG